MKTLKKITDSFWTSFGVLSRIPGKKHYNPDFSLFGFFLPLIGILVSLIVAGTFSILSPLLHGVFTLGAAILFIQYLLFNLFHFDGLLDSADALFYNTSKEKRLTILRDVNAGSYALFTGVLYIFLKLHYLISGTEFLLAVKPLDPIVMAVLFSYPLSGRIAAGIVPIILKPARKEGMGSLLSKYRFLPFLFGTGIALCLSLGFVYFRIFSHRGEISPFVFLPFLGAVLSGLIVSLLYKKLVGGFTGDALGLSVELGELFHLACFVELIGRGVL